MLGGPAETYIVSHTGRYHFRSRIVWLSASASLVRTSKDLGCKYELQYWTDQAEADMITHTPLDIVAFPNGPAKAIRVRTDSMGAAPRDAKFPLELPLPLFHGKKLPEQVGETPCDNRGQIPESLRNFLKQSPDALRDTAGENYQEHFGANSHPPLPRRHAFQVFSDQHWDLQHRANGQTNKTVQRSSSKSGAVTSFGPSLPLPPPGQAPNLV